jgi:hypothetical protein
MKVLVYGMQSSGASTFAWLLGQHPNSLTVPDLFCGELAPSLSGPFDTILKCTVTTLYGIEQHKASYRPDLTILFTRPIDDVRQSLSNRNCRDMCGKMEDKLKIYENLNHDDFDVVVSYQQMIEQDTGLVEQGAYLMLRTLPEIIDFNCKHSHWCRENVRKKWWTGGIRHSKIVDLTPLLDTAVVQDS